MIKYPFNLNTANDVNNNNKEFDGGFYPVGENNLWHSGIHLRGDGIINALSEGEIIAARITKDPIIDDDIPKVLDSITYSKSFTGKYNSCMGFYKQKIIDKFMYYELSDNLSDDNKKLIKEALNSSSNSFVLVKHKIELDKYKLIFFTLYMHLLPWGKIKDNETVRMFFREWKFKVKKVGDIGGLKLLSESDKQSTVGLIPAGTIVEEIDKKLSANHWSKIDIYKILTNTGYIYVKSLSLNKEGIIPNGKYFDDMNFQDITYKIKKDTILYYTEDFKEVTKKLKIKSDAIIEKTIETKGNKVKIIVITKSFEKLNLHKGYLKKVNYERQIKVINNYTGLNWTLPQ